MWWIRKWGLGQVLNRQLPSLKSEKWSFLFRWKVWERELQEKGGSVLSMAKDIISAPRILSNPGAFPPPLQLLIVSASERFLSAGDHRRLFDTVKQWFIIHHRVVLQYRVTLRVPLLQASLKPQLLARISEVFRSAHFWPAPLQDFLLSRVKLVSGKTPKVKNLLVSARPPEEHTSSLFEPVQPHCACHQLRNCPGVSYVHDHAVFRDPRVLPTLDRRLSPAVFSQNLKNSTIPPWPRIYGDIKKSLLRFAATLPDHRGVVFDHLLLPVASMLESVYNTIKTSTPRHMHQTHICRQRRLLPPFLTIMFFDKANEVADFACRGFWKIAHAQLLFGSPRFQEVARFHTSADASFFQFWRTMDGFCLSMFGTYFVLSNVKGLSPLSPAEALRAFGASQRRKLTACYRHQCRLVETRAVKQLKASYTHWDKIELPVAQLFPALTATQLKQRVLPDPNQMPPIPAPLTLQPDSIFFRYVADVPPPPPLYSYPSTKLPEPKCPLGVPDVLPVRKYKSKEFENPPVVKFREIVRHAASPVKITAKLVSRSLTVLWKEAVVHCPAFEFVGLESFVDQVRAWRQKGYRGTPTELDLVEMFPNVPREDIPVAVQFYYEQVTAARHLKTPFFNIHKHGLRTLDFLGAQGRDSNFFSFSLSDILAYTEFELTFNDAFVFYASIFRQTTGTAIGGTLSAQFASLVVMYRERALHDDAFFSDIPLCRYRDNYGTLSQSEQFLEQLCEKLSLALSMKITVESQGSEIPFLGCTLAINTAGLPTTRVKPPTLTSQTGDSTASTLQRWVHASSPNARSTLRSSAPNMFRGCLKYSFDRQDILINFIRYTAPLRLCYPPSWWRPLFLKRADDMGVLDLLQAVLVVPLPSLKSSSVNSR